MVNGKRIVPNACRSKAKPTVCKHEAPWTNRVSPPWMTAPLVVCKGIAKTFTLRCSGVRNWLGQILGLRNDEWVNGTMPGLCVAFAGSNTDVKPNDRLPITTATHEEKCKYKCVKKSTLKKTTRATQRTQNVSNGYFGGYIGKRQPAGSLETKKCVDKLFTLRSKMAGQGKAAQLRAASGRLITDMEMNSTYRGAVEVFNLCRNLHPHDVLFAECIRTFSSCTIDGRSWMYKLDGTQLNRSMKECCLQSYIPPTKKPNVRTDRSKANDIDIYGFRPLQHPWRLLSPYEFLRTWRAEPLLVPTYYENRGEPARTRWTDEGAKFVRTPEYKEGKLAVKPGIHYVVLQSATNEYTTFPEHPADLLGIFRNAWVLMRRTRPYVIVIEGLRMPSASRPETENAKYCSLFFRPWTLLKGDFQVPHLSLLGCDREAIEKVYEDVVAPDTKKSKVETTLQKGRASNEISDSVQTIPLLQHVHWHRAWEEYVRGHVVSESAACLIRSFLLKTIAASGATGDAADNSDADASGDDPDLPPLRLSAATLRQVLSPSTTNQVDVLEQDLRVDPKMGDKLKQKAKTTIMKSEYQKSIEIGRAVWLTPGSDEPVIEKGCPGDMYQNEYSDHIAARRVLKETANSANAPFNVERNAAATWFSSEEAGATIDALFSTIMQEEEKPNPEQKSFLQHFVRRLKVEIVEARLQMQNSSSEEPLLDIIHGFPGTGKSRVIGWMRRLMEAGLGWEHGVQFVCLAFQNAMAAQINGNTIHHWSGIPCRSVDGNTTGDRHKQSIKCQALRVVIIDELSMISAELLGALAYVMTKAIRIAGTYKKRKDGSTRAFGGVNMIMCVDWWQLQPVTGTCLCSNPLDIPAGRAQDALNLLWGSGMDTVRRFWSLTQLMRCQDVWYNSFLQQCREGNLAKDMYCFFHGLSTYSAATLSCSCNDDLVDDPVLGRYKRSWAEEFMKGCGDMGTFIKSLRACRQA